MRKGQSDAHTGHKTAKHHIHKRLVGETMFKKRLKNTYKNRNHRSAVNRAEHEIFTHNLPGNRQQNKIENILRYRHRNARLKIYDSANTGQTTDYHTFRQNETAEA